MKKLLVLYAICAMLLIAGMADAGTILTSGVWGVNNHTYTVVSFPGQTWNDSTTDMNILIGGGAYLATITSQEEQDFVESLISSFDGEYWLGASQLIDETDPSANWSWVTGELWSYTHWAPGEPNDGYGPGSEQHLAMWSNFGWKWNDEGNLGNMTGYVAESPVPEPGTLFLLGSGLAGLAGYGLRRRKRK